MAMGLGHLEVQRYHTSTTDRHRRQGLDMAMGLGHLEVQRYHTSTNDRHRRQGLERST